MKKLKMSRAVTLTFEEGCNKYLERCKQRNLRESKKLSFQHFTTYEKHDIIIRIDYQICIPFFMKQFIIHSIVS